MNAALNLNSVSMPVRIVVGVALVAGTAAMLMPAPASKPSAPIARAVRRSAPAAEAVRGARSLTDGKDAAPSLTASARIESPASESAAGPAAAPARDAAAGPAGAPARSVAVPADPVAPRTSQVAPGSGERPSSDGGSSRLSADTVPAPAATQLASAVLESERQSLAVGAPIRELFRSPLVTTKAAKTAAPPLKAPPLPPANLAPRVAAAPTPAAPPAPVGVQASSLEMLGVVELDGKPQVLIRNKDNGQRKYYTAGDSAFGFVVKEIKENEVALERAGKTEMVSMSSAVALEGPGASTVAGSSSGFGGGGFGGGGFGGGRDRGGFGGRDRGAGGGFGGSGGDRGGGRDSSSSGFSTASIMSLPTWKERLKKLEEVKVQVPAEQYDRLHKFMTARVAAEAGK